MDVNGYTLTLAAIPAARRHARRPLRAAANLPFRGRLVRRRRPSCAVRAPSRVRSLARGAAGYRGALLTPGSLAILERLRARGPSRAIGAWSGFGALANAVGPIVGGYLPQRRCPGDGCSCSTFRLRSWSWRSLVGMCRERRCVGDRRIDVPGSGVGGAGARDPHLWPDRGAGRWLGQPGRGRLLCVGVIAAVGFAVTNGGRRRRCCRRRCSRSRQFAATNVVTFLLYGALGGALFLLPVALQQVAGYSPLHAGLTLLPVTVLMFLLSARSGRLAARSDRGCKCRLVRWRRGSVSRCCSA